MAASLVSLPDFLRTRPSARPQGPWTNQELAELQRVVALLARAGLSVETDSGLTDEDDPWMVFTRPGSDDVIAHFARIDGRFVAAGAGAGTVIEGDSFRDVVDKILAHQPLVFSPAEAMSGVAASDSSGGHGWHGAHRFATGHRDGRQHADANDPAGDIGSGSSNSNSNSNSNSSGRGGNNVTTLFMHPSIVLAAFVATALMQDRKVGDASGSGTAGSGVTKAGIEARMSAPGANGRGPLQDSLLALTAPHEGPAGSGSGPGGFMLHSASMASAMALVLAAASQGAGSADDGTAGLPGTLAKATRDVEASRGDERKDDGDSAGAQESPSDHHGPGSGPRAFAEPAPGDVGSGSAQGPGAQVGPIEAAPSAACAVGGAGAQGAPTARADAGHPGFLLDPDILLPDVVDVLAEDGAAALPAEAGRGGSAPSTPDAAASGGSATAAVAAGDGAAVDLGADATGSATADGSEGRAADAGEASASTGSSASDDDDATEPGEARTARVAPDEDDEDETGGGDSTVRSELSDGSGRDDAGTDGVTLAARLALGDSPFSGLRVIDLGLFETVDGDVLLDDLPDTISVNALSSDGNLTGNWLHLLGAAPDGDSSRGDRLGSKDRGDRDRDATGDDNTDIADLDPATSSDRASARASDRASDADSRTDSHDAAESGSTTSVARLHNQMQAPETGSHLYVYGGGQVRIEGFDPLRDLLSVSGPLGEATAYELVATDEGVDIQFDAGNVVSLIGVGLDELGLA